MPEAGDTWVRLIKAKMDEHQIKSAAQLARKMTSAGYPVTRMSTSVWIREGQNSAPKPTNRDGLALVLGIDPESSEYLTAWALRQAA